MSGSRILGLRGMLETLRISVPTVLDGLLGRVTVERCNQRLLDWSSRLVAQGEIDLEVCGADAVDWGHAYVIMSNHQSLYDIPLLYQALRGTVRMVTKQELFKIPIWGRAMRDAGFVPIDRKQRHKAIESISEAGRAIQRGVNIWIAPEGTRSPDDNLLPFKKGGFILARDLGVPILPVCIDGSRHALPLGSLSPVVGQHVTVTIGAPIPVAGKSVDDLSAELRGWLEQTLGRPAATGSPSQRAAR